MTRSAHALELMNPEDTQNSAELDETLISPAIRIDVLERPEQRAQREAIAAALFGRSEEAVLIGRFRVLERLGEGGMGTVYSAYDDQLDRKVAVKLVHASHLDSTDAFERTLREARALARVSHPNVVHVYEVGEAGTQLFVAMEFLAGTTLRAWLDEGRERSWQEVLEVLRAAGEGLEAAHAEGVVHRDFKPHNVMFGADGRVRVLDFGLARFGGDEQRRVVPRASDELEDAALTMSGALLGTPAYMAPEQLAGKPAEVRSDIWGFCVTLYEALYGTRPFRGDTIGQLADAVREGRIEPPPAGRSVPAWIHAVVLRGLASDPERRFASMRELLDALADDPRRRRRRWALSAMVVLLAGGGWGVAEYVERTAASEPDWAAAEQKALRASELLSEGDEVGALALAIEAAALADAQSGPGRPAIIDKTLYDASAAELAWGPIAQVSHYASTVSFAPDGARVAIARNIESFGFEYNAIAVHDLAGGEAVSVTIERDCIVQELQFTGDGARLMASCFESDDMRIFDAHTGAAIVSFAGSRAPEFSSDGRVVATVEADAVELTSVDDGRSLIRLTGLDAAPTLLEFSPDGSRLATAGPDQDTSVWNVRTGAREARFADSAAIALRFFPDGSQRLASLGDDQQVRVWATTTGELEGMLPVDRPSEARLDDVHDLVISSDARRIAAYVDRNIWLWDVAEGELISAIEDRAENPLANDNPWVLGGRGAPLAFTPDGERLVTRRHDGKIALLDAETGATVSRSDSLVLAYAISPAGDTIAVGSGDFVEIRDAKSFERTRSLPSRMPVITEFSPDGRSLAAVSEGDWGDGWGTTLWRTVATPSPIVRAPAQISARIDVALALDGARIVAADEDVARIWASDSGEELAVLRGHVGPITAIAGGSQIATAGVDGTIRVWDPSTGRQLRALEGHAGPVRGLAFNRDGTLLGSIGDDHTARIWVASTGEPLAVLEHADAIASVAMSPDGTRLVTADTRHAHVWDLRSQTKIAELSGHHGGVRLALAISNDHVATQDTYQVRVWDAGTGAPVHELDDPSGNRAGLAFSPDGERLASANGLWHTRTGERIAAFDDAGPLERHGLAFSPDAALLALGGQLWDARSGERIGDFTPGHENAPVAMRFVAGGERVLTVSADALVIRPAQAPLAVACDRLREFGPAYAEVSASCESR